MAMSDHHKKILQVNRTNFLKNIGDVKAVVSSLLANGVITEFMEEEILANKTKTAKIQELMSLLPRRGEKAFDEFYEVLVENEEFVAADFIKPELKEFRLAQNAERNNITHTSPSIATSHIKELPSEFPDPADDMTNFVVKKCETEEMKSKLKQLSVYPFTKDKRGLCLLVNNEFFNDQENRNSDPDAIALTSLFKELNFEIIIKPNLTATDMITLVDKTCKENGDFDCFVFVVLSYGINGSVYGVDGVPVDTDDIVKNVDDCPKFRNKPKLFFIQACQTDKNIAGSGDVMADGEKSLEISIRSKVRSMLPNPEQADCNKEPSNIARNSDVYIAISVNSDVVESGGTLFPQAMVYAFKNYAHQCDLQSLMIIVNALMKLNKPDVSVITHASLNKEFYFFPGLTDAPLNQIQPS